MPLPLYELRTKEEDNQKWVWDILRKKYVLLQPEEHVRQCLVAYLNKEKGVPTGLMSSEKGLKYDRRKKRYDLVVYDRNGKPLLACECKAPYVPLDKKASLQLAVYNHKLKAPFMLWTNGSSLRFYALDRHGVWVAQIRVSTFSEMLAFVAGENENQAGDH